MRYIKNNWINDETFITAEKMNNIESGIENAKNTIIINENTDLNNIIDNGVYYLPNTYTYTNLPGTSVNGWLVVFENTGTDTRTIKQIWYRQGTINTNDWNVYIRTKTDDSWGNWTRLLVDNDATLFYKAGDTYDTTRTNSPVMNGFITSGGKIVRIALTVPKSLKNISTITCSKLTAEARSGKGYLNNESGFVNFKGSGYTVTCYKVDEHNIYINIEKSTAYTNADNNTLISFNIGDIVLTFN